MSDHMPPLLAVRDLKTHFPIRKGILRKQVGAVKAVDGVSFDVCAGQTVALVGESGCGKTTVGRSLMRLVEPSAGRVELNGIDLLQLEAKDLRAERRKIQMVFQDPSTSLNPRHTVREIIAEGIVSFGLAESKEQLESQVLEMLLRVKLEPEHLDRYPHEFSGGQRQRIGIARALAVKPQLMICDESVSALDVSIQAQILDLLQELQQQFGIAYLFITHDLSVVRYLADEVLVMFGGKIKERGPTQEIFNHPQDSYTQTLLAAIPMIEGWQPANPLR